MKVFLLADVEKVGARGEILKVSDGYGQNFLIPRKLAIEVTPENEEGFKKRQTVLEKRDQVIQTKTSLLADRIHKTEIVLKRKMHDDGKLYGSVSPQEIADVLASKGFSVAKNQIEFDKSIKAKGSYPVVVKLSSQLKPVITVRIVAE